MRILREHVYSKALENAGLPKAFVFISTALYCQEHKFQFINIAKLRKQLYVFVER